MIIKYNLIDIDVSAIDFSIGLQELNSYFSDIQMDLI